MKEIPYLHGFSQVEQRRLIQQAEYWREDLILPGLAYGAGDHILDVGCGAGAVLKVLGETFPGIHMAGIDREPAQIDFAGKYLAQQGFGDVDLKVGSADHLAWPDASFNHVYIMWLLEHLQDANPVLREAHRVLRPGGSITLTETDYTTFRVSPPNEDWDYLAAAQYDHFQAVGNPIMGRQLGARLNQSGFRRLAAGPAGFHYFNDGVGDRLRAHVDYVATFLEAAVPSLTATLKLDEARLRRGVAHLRTVPSHPLGALTTIVFRATGFK